MRNRLFVIAIAVPVLAAGYAVADGPGDPTAVKSQDGKYLDKDGDPTYKVQADGTVDWYSYSGYRRYHSECHVCHGPDGEGSTYAPALKNSLKRITYGDFLAIVAGGRKNVSTSQESVMPAFGTNPNVMCYIDDLYVYLRARSTEAIGRVRPERREPKPEPLRKGGDAGLGGKGLNGWAESDSACGSLPPFIAGRNTGRRGRNGPADPFVAGTRSGPRFRP